MDVPEIEQSIEERTRLQMQGGLRERKRKIIGKKDKGAGGHCFMQGSPGLFLRQEVNFSCIHLIRNQLAWENDSQLFVLALNLPFLFSCSKCCLTKSYQFFTLMDLVLLK